MERKLESSNQIRDRNKELEEQLKISREAHADTMNGQAKRIKVLENELKWSQDQHRLSENRGRHSKMELTPDELDILRSWAKDLFRVRTYSELEIEDQNDETDEGGDMK